MQREGHTGGSVNASFRQARRSPRAVRTLRNCTRENRETSSASGAHQPPDRSGKPKAQSGQARRRGVEPGHSTGEAAEQGWGNPGGGGGGGKAPDQGEHHGIQHTPDTERGKGAPGIAWCAGKSTEKQAGAVHRFAPSCDASATAGQFLRLKAEGCAWG